MLLIFICYMILNAIYISFYFLFVIAYPSARHELTIIIIQFWHKNTFRTGFQFIYIYLFWYLIYEFDSKFETANWQSFRSRWVTVNITYRRCFGENPPSHHPRKDETPSWNCWEIEGLASPSQNISLLIPYSSDGRIELN